MWRAALAAEIFRPSADLARIAAFTAQRIGFEDGTTVACHIRRSDKVQGRDKQAHMTNSSLYIQELRSLLHQVEKRAGSPSETPFSRLFIATDDDTALREAIEAARTMVPELQAVFDGEEKRDLRSSLVHLTDPSLSPDTVAASMNRSAIARDAVTNMALLISSQALVGTWSSAFGKVAQYTRAGRALLFCTTSGILSLLKVSDDVLLGVPSAASALSPAHVRQCIILAQLYASLDESSFAEFDPL